jgi:outer membrane protein OmpA-like peptidoglycan-associated protein
MRSALIAATVLSLLPLAAVAQPVTGLYVGAGGGVDFLQSEQLRGVTSKGTPGVIKPNPANTTATYNPGYAGLGSIGWGFGNGVRLEIEGDTTYNQMNSHNAAPRGLKRTGNERKYGAMANVLFDMDIGSPYVFPYLGAGAGYRSVMLRESQTDPSGIVESTHGTSGGFAYQAIAGVSLPIPWVVGLSATVEYRYLGLAGIRAYDYSQTSGGAAVLTGTRHITGDDNHQVLVGLRYAFNVPRPAAPTPVAAVAPMPAPPAAAARSYLVFFDWDGAELSTRARQIIADAATASTKVPTTQISVAGHADSSGTPAYNMALSKRRADGVAAELVRLGVPKAEISISSFGDTHPLVPTAPGVREPQNRRVEIVLK